MLGLWCITWGNYSRINTPFQSFVYFTVHFLLQKIIQRLFGELDAFFVNENYWCTKGFAQKLASTVLDHKQLIGYLRIYILSDFHLLWIKNILLHKMTEYINLVHTQFLSLLLKHLLQLHKKRTLPWNSTRYPDVLWNKPSSNILQPLVWNDHRYENQVV